MNVVLRCAASAAAVMTLAASPVLATTWLDREFQFPAEQFRIAQVGGETSVSVTGSTRDFTPGHPDLPLLAREVELPAGMHVASVQVTALETAPLAAHAHIPPAIAAKPGLGPVARTVPDAVLYTHAGFQPEQAAKLGTQGSARGRNVAWLQIAPVRWNAATGALERVSRMRVKIGLESGVTAAVERRRIVPQWESDPIPQAVREQATITSAAPVGGRHPQPFQATQLPSVLGSPVEYVIITNDAMAAEFQRLADWKTQSGVPAVVRTLSFIEQQYPGAADDAERMRLFIRDAYSLWGAKWVLLGGDTDVLPTRYAHSTFYAGEEIACDMYFSCLDGTWDADGDHDFGEAYADDQDHQDEVDLLPEVWVGRAPTTTVAQAKLFVDKSLQYVRQPAGDYENRTLLFAEVLFPQPWQTGEPIDLDGAQLAENLVPYTQAMPGTHVGRLYQTYNDPNWAPTPSPESRAAVIDSLNHGYNISSHIGHGYRNVMSVGDLNLDNNDALALTNGTRLTNLYAANCTSNAIDFPSIGEAFLLAPNGGAVTNIGSSRYDFPSAGQFFEEEYFRLMFVDSVTAVGEAQGRQKLPFAAYSNFEGLNRWTTLTLLLLGDPELRIYTTKPRILTVTHASSIPLSDTTIAVNVKIAGVPLEGAQVVAYKANDDYRVGTTNASGNVTLPFRPDSVGSFTLTVTGFNCKPYQATVNLTTSAVPVLADQTPTFDDDGLGGTLGDSNGKLDGGETVDMKIPLRNNGAAAPNVVGTLSTTDPLCTIINPTVNYGAVGAGALVTPSGAYRISVPYNAPDQHVIPFKLAVNDGAGRTIVEDVRVTINAPDLQQYEHLVSDAGGNNDGRADPGETVTYTLKLRNVGAGTAHSVSVRLRDYDGLATVTDSSATFGDIAPGQEKTGDALVFVPNNVNAKLEIRVRNASGELWTQMIDIVAPFQLTGLQGYGLSAGIKVIWNPSFSTDLRGYYVYRSTSQGGPFARVNPVPTDQVAYYLDAGLAPLTRFYYKVSAVDSSGNESVLSQVESASTNPPLHSLFPVAMGQNTISSVAVDHVYGGYPLTIVAGSEHLYVLYPDGNAPVDGDGSGATHGDFSTRGLYFAAGPSIADLDGDGVKEIVGASMDSSRLYVFDTNGNVKSGWPNVTADPSWSSAAIGDLNHDGSKELVIGTNGNKLYAFRANGNEWMDGDSNVNTKGVFKVLGNLYNYGTPALAPLEGGTQLDIVFGAFEGKVFAWRPDGTNVPGFPVTLSRFITSSVAVGYLDGAGDNQLETVVVTGSLTTSGTDSLYVFKSDGGRRAGFPRPIKGSGNNKCPSPALADMNNDGFLDIVCAGTDGVLTVVDRNGNPVAPCNGARYSNLTVAASESSPVVADINGDGMNDIVIGDEDSQLTAISGLNATVLPGFPIQLAAEVKGTPAVCDCDGDGQTEILVAGWDHNLYMWDYNFPFSPNGQPPWPQFHHDAARTGLASNPAFVSVQDDRTVPTRLELALPQPNPTRTGAFVSWAVPAEHAGTGFELAVFDLSGRRVKTIDSGAAHVGRHTARWDLLDASGHPSKAGVYFVRLTLGHEARAQKIVILD